MEKPTFKSLLHVYGFFGAGLKVGNVTLGLTEGHRALGGDHALVLLHIDLITDHDLFSSAEGDRAKRMKRGRVWVTERVTYERKILRIMRTSLDQEFIPPAIQRLETLRIVDIVHKNTAVRTTVERDAQRLKALLASGIPDLIDSR